MAFLQSHVIFFGRLLYYSAAGLSVLWAIQAFRVFGRLWSRGTARAWAPALVAALVLSTVVFRAHPPDYRVLSDEATLTSISYMMRTGQTASVLFYSSRMGGELTPLKLGIDKRPPLFPFLVHLAHWTCGYSPSNPYAVNFLLLTALLAMAFLVMARSYGPWIGFLGALLVAAEPPVFLTATSAGFDLLASVMLALSLLSFAALIAKPGPDRLGFTLATVALLASTRYESALFAAVIAACSLAVVPDRWTALRREIPWLATLAILFAPIAVLALYSAAFPEFREHGERGLFSQSYFFPNLRDLIMGLFSPPSHLPNLSFLYELAAVSGVFLVRRFVRERSPRAKAVWLGFALSSASLLIMLSLFSGSYLSATSLRLFLPFSVAVALLPALAAGCVIGVRGGAKGALACALALATFAWANFERSSDEIFHDSGATRGYSRARAFLADKDPSSTLIVSAFPTHFAILGFNSLDFETFQSNEEKIESQLARGRLAHVYFIQERDLQSGAPLPNESFSTRESLRTLDDFLLSSRGRQLILEPVSTETR